MEGQISYPSCFREGQMSAHSFFGRSKCPPTLFHEGANVRPFFSERANVLPLVLGRGTVWGKYPGEENVRLPRSSVGSCRNRRQISILRRQRGPSIYEAVFAITKSVYIAPLTLEHNLSSDALHEPFKDNKTITLILAVVGGSEQTNFQASKSFNDLH